jgi:phospholipase A1
VKSFGRYVIRLFHQPGARAGGGNGYPWGKMKKTLQYTAGLLITLMATIGGAADLEMTLAPPQPPIQSGTTVILDLYLHNTTATTIVRHMPLSIPCRIDTDRSSLTVTANLEGRQSQSKAQIPGRSFARRQYAVRLPVYATGSVRLMLKRLATNPLTIAVESAPPEAWVGEQVPLDEDPTLVQSYLENLSVHEPLYFLLGIDPGLEKSKFQFSFKYRLFNSEGWMAEAAPWVSGFYLAYTQCSLWDLYDDSKPFEDTSYLPEIFYLLPKIDLNIDRITAFGVQTGFQHESNGSGGEDSRSTNYLYVKPILGTPLAGPFHLKIAPRLYTYVNNSDDSNPDLWAYRGYLDLEMGIIDPQGLALDSHLWWAPKGVSLQLDLTYPMTRLLNKSLNLYLQAQYFSGYAETLLYYNRRHDAFRLGIAIVR